MADEAIVRDRPRVLPSVAALLMLMAAPPVSGGDPYQGYNQARVRAAFVLNLSRFVEWPPETAAQISQIRVCTLGDDPLAGALEAASFGKTLNGAPVEVVTVASPRQYSGCHVLYVSHWSARHLPKVLAAVKGTPVLTISDAPGFIELGGLVGVRMDGAQVRFSVNREVARRAGLRFSSQLLRLADTRF